MGWLRLTLQGSALTSSMITPAVTVNGWRVPSHYGENVIPVHAGPNRIDVSCQWLMKYGRGDARDAGTGGRSGVGVLRGAVAPVQPGRDRLREAEAARCIRLRSDDGRDRPGRGRTLRAAEPVADRICKRRRGEHGCCRPETRSTHSTRSIWTCTRSRSWPTSGTTPTTSTSSSSGSRSWSSSTRTSASASCCVTQTRQPSCASRRPCRCWSPPSSPPCAALYAELDAKVALYCNNSLRNFHSLLEPRMLHAHISHGESDKQSMASNNAKSYDRVFVAGEAAVQRHATGLLEFDLDRLVRIGRPQLDLHREPVLAPSTRRTVLYAPTWEGDADYNNYSSVDTIGPEIVRAVLAVPDVRLVYKPHPRVATSEDHGDPVGAPPDRRAGGARRRPRPLGRAPLADRRRHPGRHAGLRRDGHRRLVGGAGLALPAHRAPAADRRPPRRPRAAAAGRAGEPVPRTSSTRTACTG